MIWNPLLVLRFVIAVIATSPQATPELATRAALEALIHAETDVPAPILAAVAYEESKFQDVRGKAAAVCGVMQVATGGRERECVRLLNDRAYSYARGKAKLREARAWCGRRGDACTHSVYGGGNAWRARRPQAYAARVLERARALEAAIRVAPVTRRRLILSSARPPAS